MSADRDPGPDTGHAHAVGTLAEEAGQLLDAVAVRLRGMQAPGAATAETGTVPADLASPDLEPPVPGPPVVGAGPPVAAAEGHIAGATRSCVGWCPICRSADVLQGDRPELTEKLVDAALLVVTTLRALIPPATAAPTPTRSTAGGPDGLERIDIR